MHDNFLLTSKVLRFRYYCYNIFGKLTITADIYLENHYDLYKYY